MRINSLILRIKDAWQPRRAKIDVPHFQVPPLPLPFTVENFILIMYFDPKALTGDFPIDLFPAFVEADLPQIGYTYLCICMWKINLFLNSEPRHCLMTPFEVHIVSNVRCINVFYLPFRWPCSVINSYNKTNQMH